MREPIDFGYKRIEVIDDSHMFFGFEAWDTFINNPGRLTLEQKARLIEDGISSDIIAGRTESWGV